MKKILLLDIENLPKTEIELSQLLNSYAFIYLVYAKSPITLSLDGLQNLSEHVAKKRLVLIKMPKTGPDAADFGLSFVAGQLSIQMDKSNTEFDVMSNDKKFEYIVDMLKIMGFKASQIKKDGNIQIKGLKQALQNIDPNKTEFKSLFTAINLLLKNQPKQFNSLNNALKSWMAGSGANIKQTIELLKKYQFIQIKNQNVSYELTRMKEALKAQEKLAVKSLAVNLPEIGEIQNKPHLQRLKMYCNYLAKIMQNKPAKPSSLINSIQSVLRLDNQQAAQDFMHILQKHNIMNQDNTKISYNDQLIEAWSDLDESCLNTAVIPNVIVDQPDTEIVS